MSKIIITFLSYILILFNTILVADDNKDGLKVGLLAPFSGDYRSLGESLLLSTGPCVIFPGLEGGTVSLRDFTVAL